MITIIDYGMGNLRSVQKAFSRLNIDSEITNDVERIGNATKLILPGVGHFSNGMKKLIELGIKDILQKKVMIERIPILGICLGMQLFGNFSEEGNVEGLGWIDADIVKFTINGDKKFKVPHMGWNTLAIQKTNSLLSDINPDDEFYFVHSYFMICKNEKDILSKTKYKEEFVSAIQRKNIYGTQFHPEKSHKNGLQILKNFATKV